MYIYIHICGRVLTSIFDEARQCYSRSTVKRSTIGLHSILDIDRKSDRSIDID